MNLTIYGEIIELNGNGNEISIQRNDGNIIVISNLEEKEIKELSKSLFDNVVIYFGGAHRGTISIESIESFEVSPNKGRV